MRPPLTRKLAGFGTTVFAEMTRLANEHGAINLAQGFPDFDGPDFVKDAAIAAIRDGHGQYAPMSGLATLQRAIATDYRTRNGISFDPTTEILVGCGATELIFASIQGVCDVGDEVVLFEPFYDSYRASVCMAGATPRVVSLRFPDFAIDERELRRAFSARTRAIVVNTPHNPTGKVLTRAELDLIAKLCIEHDVLCIFDEVYERLVYGKEHVSMATLPGMRERTILLNSLSKTFSFTGWRVGWALAPAPLLAAVRSAHQFVTFSAPMPLQHGAVAALHAPRDYYDDLVATYRRRRDLLTSVLDSVGFEVRVPDGSYFVCAGFSRFGFDDDVAFCRHLVEKIGVAAIPPSFFHENVELGRRYVRFTFAKKDETLHAAAERLCALRA